MTLREIARRAAEAHAALEWTHTPTPEQARRIISEKKTRKRALDEKTHAILQEYKNAAKERTQTKPMHEKSGPKNADNPAPAPPASVGDEGGGAGTQAQPGAARRTLAIVAVTALAIAALLGVKR